MAFPFTFIYCEKSLSNGSVWVSYFNKLNECPTNNFSVSNAVVMNEVHASINTQRDMMSVI